MKKKIWNIYDKDFKYEEYQNDKPERLFVYYGNKLEEDTSKLFEYEYSSNVVSLDSFPIMCKSVFYIKVKDNYKNGIFEITYPSDKLYPCKFHSILTENRYDCNSKEELQTKLELEIANERLGQVLSNILHYFYSNDEVEKALLTNE